MYFHLENKSRSLPFLPSLQTPKEKLNPAKIIPKDSVSSLLNPEAGKSLEKSKIELSIKTGEQNLGFNGLNQMKNTLKHSYSKQIKDKTNEELLNKRLKIMQENDYLSHFQKHIDFQARKNKQEKQQYRSQLLSQMKQKKIIIDSVKTEEVELSRMYQEPRERSFNHKSQAYREFYEQSKRYQKEVEKQYIDYMKVEQFYEKAKNKDKISNYEHNYNSLNKHNNQESKLSNMKRQNLKKMLEQQMKVNESRNRVSMGSYGRQGRQKYSTIANPIDYKMDMNNKYVLRQISILN